MYTSGVYTRPVSFKSTGFLSITNHTKLYSETIKTGSNIVLLQQKYTKLE